MKYRKQKKGGSLKVQNILPGTLELRENDVPYIWNYICVIETTSVFSPKYNPLEVSNKMITSFDI